MCFLEAKPLNIVFRLSFTTKISLPDTPVELEDGLTVNTSPLGVGVTFVCDYATSVLVETNAFTVQDISITGTHSDAGSLKDGFTLSAGDGTPTLLGNDLTVKTSWTLDLPDVSLHYAACSVNQGALSVPIVKDGCMATILGAELIPTASGVSNEVAMKYATFTLENELATEQIVICDVKLCTGTVNCAYDKTTCVSGPFGYE